MAQDKQLKLYEYEDALEYVRSELGLLREEKGLKEWCNKYNIHYTTTINVLNKKTEKEYPLFLQNVLKALGHKVKMHKVTYFICTPSLSGTDTILVVKEKPKMISSKKKPGTAKLTSKV